MSDKKGFTLVELLVVVMLISILAAIAVPRYITVVERSKVAKAKNTLGLIARTMKMYGTFNSGNYAAYATEAALVLGLANYTNLTSVTTGDTEWTYTTTTTGGAGTFSVIATRVAGPPPNATATITVNHLGTIGGTHTLR